MPKLSTRPELASGKNTDYIPVEDSATNPSVSKYITLDNLKSYVGGGDVVGPASSTDGFVPQYDGTTGKLLKEGVELKTTNLTDISTTPANAGQILKWNAVNSEYEPSDDETGGDVSGPASSTAGYVPQFSDTTGKVLGQGVELKTTSLNDVSTSTPTEGQILKYTAGEWTPSNDATGGDVDGPASSVDSNVALFDGTTGKTIKDGGPLKTTTLTDISSNTPTDGQILKYNAANSEYEPSNDATGGDVTGPASSTAGYVPQFSDTTGKVLGQGVELKTTSLTDVSTSAPTEGQVLKYTAGEWTPSNDATGGDVTGPASSTDNHVAMFDGTTGKLLKDGGPIDVVSGNLYTTVVKSSGGDHTTVSAALTAGATRIIVDGSIASPISETANWTINDNVSIFIIGRYNLGDYQIDFNNVGSKWLRISGFGNLQSVLTTNYTTDKPVFINRNQSSIHFEEFEWINLGTGGEARGVIQPNSQCIIRDLTISVPNAIRCGLDLSETTAFYPSMVNRLKIIGGGTSCGAAFVPGPNMRGDVHFSGGYYQNPTTVDAADNKHAFMWTDPTNPISYDLSVSLNMGTTNTLYSMVVSGNIEGITQTNVSPISLNIITVGNNITLNNIDFGSYDTGSYTGGQLFGRVNSSNVKLTNSFNLGKVDGAGSGLIYGCKGGTGYTISSSFALYRYMNDSIIGDTSLWTSIHKDYFDDGYVASNKEYITADASAGSFTINAPADPRNMDEIRIFKEDFGAGNTITFAAAGKTIVGDNVLHTQGNELRAVWNNFRSQWQVTNY